MKINYRLLALALLSVSASTAFARAPVAVPGLEPNSYTTITGRQLHPDWLDTNLGFSPLAGGPALPIFDQKTPNSSYIAQMDQDGSSWDKCITVGATEVPILSLEVTPTGAGFLDIGFSTQAAINSGTVQGSTIFFCSVTQLGVTAACSGSIDGPALVQRIRTSNTPGSARLGNLGFTAYHGYVSGLIPAVPATVKITAAGLPAAATTVGQLCYTNLIVRNAQP